MGQFEEQLLNLSHNRSRDNNQCQCLSKAELKTKTNPNSHKVVAVWVHFGFQLGLRRTLAQIIIRNSIMGQIEELLRKLSPGPSAL